VIATIDIIPPKGTIQTTRARRLPLMNNHVSRQTEPVRVPHVRASVRGPKKTGEAHPELLLL
jgi:hypothetical protein